MMRLRLFLFMVLFLAISSCSEDFLYNEIDVSDIENPDLLNVIAIYRYGDTELSLDLSRTLSVEEVNNTNINSALGNYTAVLKDENSRLIDSASCQNCRSLDLEVKDRIKPGVMYSLTVKDLTAGDQVVARAALAEKPNITLEILNRVDDSTRELKMDIKIQDNANNNDYYHIDHINIEGRFISRSSYFYPPEHLESFFEYNLNYDRILPDISFRGDQFSIPYSIDFNNAPRSNDTLKVELVTENWPEDFYTFGKSVNNIEEANYNPFIEPASIRGNFDNGIGVFALVHRDSYITEIILE